MLVKVSRRPPTVSSVLVIVDGMADARWRTQIV
jgi:hypothetical protein